MVLVEAEVADADMTSGPLWLPPTLKSAVTVTVTVITAVSINTATATVTVHI